MLDASSNAYHVSSSAVLQPVLYGNDTTIGPYWTFTAPPNASSGTALDVQSSNSNSGLNPTNFDFVQNTGVFTLTTFVNIGASTGGYMTLFDTDGGLTTSPGFSLLVQQDGQLYLNVSTGSAQSVRFSGTGAGLNLAPNQWYFLAVVGSGPNNSVQFFAAPVSTSSMTDYFSAATLTGANGTYNTDASHDLFIGGRTDSAQGQPFNGEMVNQAIFNTALTPPQIQQLFLFGKAEVNNQLATPAPGSVSLLPSSDSGVSNSDRITNRNNSGPSSTLQFQISGTITGAVVTLFADGTPIGSATATGATTVITTNGSSVLADGTHAITAQQIENGRPTSVNSNALTVQIDTTPPIASITSVTPNPSPDPVSQMTIVFNEPAYGLDLTDFTLTRNNGSNLLTGSQTLSTTDHITWTLGNLSSLTGTLGSYTLNLTLAGTPVTDAAGNASQAGSSTSFMINPITAAPTSVGLAASSDTGISNSDGITQLNNHSPSTALQFQVSGTLAGAVVSIFVDGNLIGSATASGSTTLVTTDGSTTLSAGPHSVTANQTLGSHPTSASTAPLSILVDTTAPTGGISSVIPNPRSSSVAQMNLVFSEPVYGLDLTDLQLTRNGGANLLTGSQTVSTSDHITWTLGNLGTITSLQGSYALNLTLAGTPVTDAAGNVDQTTAGAGFTVDATSSAIVSLVSSSDTGISNSDGITKLNNSSPAAALVFQVTGTTTGATVTVWADGNPIGSATANGSTTLVTTDGVTTLSDGTHSVIITQSQSGQPTSTSSNSLTILVDTVQPTHNISSVTPSPRTSSVPQMTIVFSEPIYGLSLNDLQLTRNGGANLLTGAQTISTTDNITWTLGNLATLTNTAGSYVLSLTMAGTPVTDAAGNVDVTPSRSNFTVSAAIFTEALFYNNSKFDGNNASITTKDDRAIATDKSAYLPGSGTTTFANLSSYTLGISGIMVDIEGETGTIAAERFCIPSRHEQRAQQVERRARRPMRCRSAAQRSQRLRPR